ncbi:MAG: VOC family protein [Acidimicrobiia bacterium]
MITAVHTLVYSDDPEATRAFFRDVLGWPFVTDAGTDPGWLIFRTGPSEMGVHPTHSTHEGRDHVSPRQHVISIMCDDIATTAAELEARGATFGTDVFDRGFGLVRMLEVPGADPIMLYQPSHPTAYDL